jgi:hypothetical protein
VRLPASAQAEKLCRYFVQFNFNSLLVIPQGRVERTTGTGTFYVELAASDTTNCAENGVVIVKHEHQPLVGEAKDTTIVMGPGELSGFCLALKGRGTKTLTAVVAANVQVTGTSDGKCDRRRKGGVEVRAGEPFNYVRVAICHHRERYWPVGQDPPAKVTVKIDIKPAGTQ